jgi:hypothetical protein
MKMFNLYALLVASLVFGTGALFASAELAPASQPPRTTGIFVRSEKASMFPVAFATLGSILGRIVSYYFAFAARTFAHLAFCAIDILRLPAAEMFLRGAIVVEREFVVRRRELAPRLSSTATACSSLRISAFSSATSVSVFMAKRISARLPRCRTDKDQSRKS